MALQRERAERRLYERVLALSSAAGTLPSALGIAAPLPRDDSALGTLLGRDTRVEKTISGNSNNSDVKSLPAAAGGAVPPPPVVPRLLSVYASANGWMAEMRLSGGRRLELEVDDTFMDMVVERIDETGVTFNRPGKRSSVSKFIAVGQHLDTQEPTWPR